MVSAFQAYFNCNVQWYLRRIRKTCSTDCLPTKNSRTIFFKHKLTPYQHSRPGAVPWLDTYLIKTTLLTLVLWDYRTGQNIASPKCRLSFPLSSSANREGGRRWTKGVQLKCTGSQWRFRNIISERLVTKIGCKQKNVPLQQRALSELSGLSDLSNLSRRSYGKPVPEMTCRLCQRLK